MSWCLVPGIGVEGGGVGVCLADCRPIWICFMWPFCVSSDSGKCFMTLAAVSPGSVVRLPFQIDASRVFLLGKPSAAWGYRIVCAVDGRS